MLAIKYSNKIPIEVSTSPVDRLIEVAEQARNSRDAWLPDICLLVKQTRFALQ